MSKFNKYFLIISSTSALFLFVILFLFPILFCGGQFSIVLKGGRYVGSSFVRRVPDSSAQLFPISLMCEIYTWQNRSDTRLIGGWIFCGHEIKTNGGDGRWSVILITGVIHMISIPCTSTFSCRDFWEIIVEYKRFLRKN